MSTETVMFDIASNDAAENNRTQKYENILAFSSHHEEDSTFYQSHEVDQHKMNTFIEPLKDVSIHPLVNIWSKSSKTKEILLQEWAGIVLSFDIKDEYFRARLIDKTNEANSDEEADILLHDVPDEDIDLVSPGAEFTWHIYYETGRSISKKRSSKIKFRRLVLWNKKDINNAKDRERELLEFFKGS